MLGNYTRKIHKNEQVKIGAGGSGNLEEEILGGHGFNIANSMIGQIGSGVDTNNKNHILSIGGNQATTVGGALAYTVGDRITIRSSDNIMIHGNKRVALVSINSIDIVAGSIMNIQSAAVGTMTFSGDGSTITATNDSSIAIGLTTHFHRDTPGLGSNPTSVPEEAAVEE